VNEGRGGAKKSITKRGPLFLEIFLQRYSFGDGKITKTKKTGICANALQRGGVNCPGGARPSERHFSSRGGGKGHSLRERTEGSLERGRPEPPRGKDRLSFGKGEKKGTSRGLGGEQNALLEERGRISYHLLWKGGVSCPSCKNKKKRKGRELTKKWGGLIIP